MQARPHVLIAAISALALTQLAVAAGYRVTVIDAYADEDTRALAEQVLTVSCDERGFEAAAFAAALIQLDSSSMTGMVYGSGFEARPDLLELAQAFLPVLGNGADVVRRCKQPQHFFPLLQSLGLPYPPTRLPEANSQAWSAIKPAAGDAWLYKRGGGCGGLHVQPADTVPGMAGDAYLQRKLAGRTLSLLFVADGHDMQPVGVHAQWLSPGAHAPYRYGGAVSLNQERPACYPALLQAAQTLTRALGLRGLNGIDVIEHGPLAAELETGSGAFPRRHAEAGFHLLELNPRPTATVTLYPAQSDQPDLFSLHIAACQGVLLTAPSCSAVHAHAVVYAVHAVTIPAGLRWPPWVSDIPSAGACIAADSPLCSVHASADDAAAARALVQQRLAEMQAWLRSGLSVANYNNNDTEHD
ncbi:ATP-grasp domain-containing protein [Methylobacillus flagellatus]|uniref:ATP-grasp domain-containing protein n=1 Tax=Methylobacillus flagellatus TaxID=405 RepID=UPI0010F49E7B|nr:ATP-grasp domain-containing protein [Methylobacillus flagellatus]